MGLDVAGRAGRETRARTAERTAAPRGPDGHTCREKEQGDAEEEEEGGRPGRTWTDRQAEAG